VGGRKILVVDDEPDIRTLCKVNLEYEGYEVLEASDGAEALEIVHDQRPDLIVLDLMMPKMDGWEVMKQLKGSAETSTIPVLFLTSKADQTSQIQGWDEGIAEYITKPFNPIVLSRCIQKALTDPSDEHGRRDQMKDQLKLRKELGMEDASDGEERDPDGS